MLRKEGGRGLASIDDCVDVTIQEVKECTKKKRPAQSAGESLQNTPLFRRVRLPQ